MISIFIAIPLDEAAFLERLKKIMEGNDLEEKRNRLRALQKRRLESLLRRSKARNLKKQETNMNHKLTEMSSSDLTAYITKAQKRRTRLIPGSKQDQRETRRIGNALKYYAPKG